jgi:hypothetical protein
LIEGLATALLVGAPGTPATAADAPRLNALLKAARLVVRAHVADVTEYDNGRVVTATLRVEEVLKGTPPPKESVGVIEMRDLPTPPLFETGRHVIAFLVPAGRNTYLAKHVPSGDYMSVVRVKPGSLTARSADDAAAMAKLIGRISQRPERDAGRRAITTRKGAFDLLGASHPILVEDGITSVAGIEDLSTSLTSDEQQGIEATLGRTDLPLRLRVLLIQTVADRGLKQVVPALRAIDAPELTDAAWHALSRLGAPPAREDIERQLASTEPRMRTAAIQQLLRQEKAGAISRATQIARADPDTAVRVAAIEALGAMGGAEAVGALENVYTEPTWETRQAVARALMRIGGRPAAEAFERLAFTGPVDGQRYAVMLLLLSVPREDVLVQRVIKTHPDAELRDLAEHGIEMHDH